MREHQTVRKAEGKNIQNLSIRPINKKIWIRVHSNIITMVICPGVRDLHLTHIRELLHLIEPISVASIPPLDEPRQVISYKKLNKDEDEPEVGTQYEL